MYQDFNVRGGPRNVIKRVKMLRAELKARGIDAFLVPHTNQFQSEYLPECDERLLWLTGFSGSAGAAVLTEKKGALFVDGRYTIQAHTETKQNLFNIHDLINEGPLSWITEHLEKGQNLGLDPKLHSVAAMRNIQRKCIDAGIKIKELVKNPIDDIWKDQPHEPVGDISLQPAELTGQSAEEKIEQLREDLRKASQSAQLITNPESIAWLLNMRGKDITHTPIALCYLLVTTNDENLLFINPDKIDDEVKSRLQELASVTPFSSLKTKLQTALKSKRDLQIDPASCPHHLYTILEKAGAKLTESTDSITLRKAIKNDAEIAGMRRAHERDGVAVCRFLMWLYEKAENGRIDEISATEKLEFLRVQTGKLKDISFPTISAFGSNGAIVHYRVSYDSNKKLKPGSLYLCDSGAQYLDGTTDITRTIAIGKPTKEMCVHYTLVLKAHIALATARFPHGTNGAQLDALARRPLWDHGLDFDHGTGHGVGCYLGVHEGPQSISKRSLVALEPGMIVSNEPGLYMEDDYGIRTENLMLVNPPSKKDGEMREMLSFSPLTLAPFDLRLIVASLLTQAEIHWVNRYHTRIYESLGPVMLENEQIWLKSACAEI